MVWLLEEENKDWIWRIGFGDPHKHYRSGGPKVTPTQATERITRVVCWRHIARVIRFAIVAVWQAKTGEVSNELSR
jgi:hypothetical protein